MNNCPKKTKNFVKEQDEFGHGISLKFNGGGGTSKTFMGGSISLLARIFMDFFVIISVIRIFTHEFDQYTTWPTGMSK